MSGHPTRSAVAEKEASTSKEGMSLEEKIGMAKKFDREMKRGQSLSAQKSTEWMIDQDYAKATVKEFLGIYGYEEDADINMDESASQKSGETSTSQAVDKQTETEPTTSTDCDGDKTSPEKAGPMAVETIDLETYDVNGVSEISIPSIEGTSRLESGRSDSEVPEVSCSSDEVLNQPCSTETLMSDVETSELDVESQCEIGSQEESQGELGLRSDALGSQRELQSQSDVCELQGEVGILCDPLGSQEKEQSHSGVSKSQGELGTSEQSEELGSKGSQNIEILGLHKKHQSESEVLSSHNTDKIQDEALEVHTELMHNSETPETHDEVATQSETMSLSENIKSGIQISELQSELQNQKLGSQIEPQLQNESTESQDQAGTSNETLGIWSEVQTQTEDSHSRDDLETLHETSGPQGELQSSGKGCESQNSRIPSQTLGSNIPVLILAVEETTLQSVQARSVSTEKLLEELSQTGETLVLVDGTLEMHEGKAKSTPTPSKILDAISHMILRAESTGEPTVLQEHSYATIGSTSSVAAPGQISQDVSSSLSDSAYGSVERERSNATRADESNIECINVEPSTSDGGKESYLISTVQSSPVGVSVSSENECLGSTTQSSPMKVSGSLKDAGLSDESNLIQGSDDITSSVAPSRSSEIASADISTNNPGLNSRIAMQPLSVSNSSLESERGSDNIPSSVTSSIRSKEITHQSGSNYNIELTTMQPLRHSSISNSSLKTVSSQNVESYSVQGTDDIILNDPSRTSSDGSNQRTPDMSTNTPSINPTTQLPTMQPPTFLSIGNSSLEAVQSKPFSASPTDLTNVTSKGKGRLWTKKHRANETPEKREGRLRAQRERARMRRSTETDVEREARREKDRKRQQLKRARDKGMEDGDIVDASSQTPQPTKDKISIEDRGLLNPFSTTSQSSMSEVLEGAIDETGVQCSSVVKPGVIPEGTVTIPAKRPKIMQGTEFTVTPVSSEGRKVIDGQQISSGESDNEQSDLCQRAEKGDVQKITSSHVILPEVTDDIPLETSASESSVLREDRDVIASTTTTTQISQDNSDDSALPENREELDMHRKIDLLNNQILSGLTEPTTSKTIAPGLSPSPDDKNIPDHKSCSILETTSATPKDSQPEEQSDPTRDTSDSSRQSNSLLETSSRKLNSLPLPEEHNDSLRDTTKSSRPSISPIETSSGKSKGSQPKENPDPPGVTTSLSLPEEHNDSLRDTTKSSRPDISPIETSSGKSKDCQPKEDPDPPRVTTSSSLPEEHNDSLRDITKSSRPDISLIETSSGKSKGSESEENPYPPRVTTSSSLPEEHNDSLRDTTKLSRPVISLIETSSGKSKDSEPEENPDPPGVTTSLSLPEEHNDSLRDTTKSYQKEKNRQNVRKRRALETPEQRDARLKEQCERVRKRRANETDAERETRRVRDRVRQQMKRTSESEENRSKRLSQQKDAARRRRALESPDEKVARRIKDRDRARKCRESQRAGVVMEWW